MQVIDRSSGPTHLAHDSTVSHEVSQTQTRSTTHTHSHCHEGHTPRRRPDHAGVRISLVVLFFEILLILAAVLITWFGVYTLYRLVTDES